MKRMARDFQNQFNEALREAELDSLKKDVEDIAKIDPMADVHKEMAKTNAEIMTELNKPVVDPAAPRAIGRRRSPDEQLRPPRCAGREPAARWATSEPDRADEPAGRVAGEAKP